MKEIPGYPKYGADEAGNIWSNWKGWRMLKPGTVKGYLTYSLFVGGKQKSLKGHRLVALTFLLNPENKPCVCHKNNVPTDNRVENLYWGTHAENSSQMVNQGRTLTPKGNDHYKSQLTEKQVRVIKWALHYSKHRKRGIGVYLAKAFKVTPLTIYFIASGKNWKHVVIAP